MRVIDADYFKTLIETTIGFSKIGDKIFGLENDEFCKGKLAAYEEVLKFIEEEPKIEIPDSKTDGESK